MAHEEESLAARTEALLEEAESLTWALLDDRLAEADAARLAQLLEESQAARTRYIECVQLHVDLQDHYAAGAIAAQTKPTGAAVMPNLMPGGFPGAEYRPPVAD
jgi:hypothetical protein